MYEYKQFYLWVMIIPFWVLHIFGTPTILSKYDIFDLGKDAMSIDLFVDYGPAKNEFEDLIDMNGLETEINQICSDEQRGDFCLRRFIKRLKKWRMRFADEFCVCDNRIDRIDTKFTASLCAKSTDINDISSVTVA